MSALLGSTPSQHPKEGTSNINWMPGYLQDEEGNILDESGNILEERINPSTGYAYYVIKGTDTPSAPALSGSGYENYQKLVNKQGGEYGENYYIRVISEMMMGFPGAKEDYFNALDTFKADYENLYGQAKLDAEKMLTAYQDLGENYFTKSEVFMQDYEENRDKYDTAWNSLRRQSTVIDRQYNNLLAAQTGLAREQNALARGTEIGPTKTVNIAGMNVPVQDLRSRKVKSDLQGAAGNTYANMANTLALRGNYQNQVTGSLGDLLTGQSAAARNYGDTVYNMLSGQYNTLGAQNTINQNLLAQQEALARAKLAADNAKWEVEGLMPINALGAQSLAQVQNAASGGGGSSGILGSLLSSPLVNSLGIAGLNAIPGVTIKKT